MDKQYMASFMNKLILYLMAALCLIVSAIAVHTANAQTVAAQAAKSTRINNSALPYTINAPGTYIAAANLVCPAEVSAITVNASVAGPIIIDLKGFTLSSVSPGMSSDSVAINIQSNPTASSITVRNGGIQNFLFGVQAASVSGANPTYLSNINVGKMIFYNVNVPIHFTGINSSSVSNCIFIGGGEIYDAYSQGGNNYNNNSFPDGGSISIAPGANTLMERLSFDEPAKE